MLRKSFVCIGMWIMLMGALVAPQSLYAQCVTPPSGMVAWWPGDNSTNDIINHNNGELKGTATYDNGKVVDAFLLANYGDYVRVPYDPNGKLDFGEGDLTIDAWIKTSSTSSDFLTIVDKRAINHTRGYTMYITLGGGGLAIEFMAGSGSGYVWASNNFDHLRDNDWHHVAITVDRDSPTGGKMYVDGQLDYTFDPTKVTGDISTSCPLCIGRICGG